MKLVKLNFSVLIILIAIIILGGEKGIKVLAQDGSITDIYSTPSWYDYAFISPQAEPPAYPYLASSQQAIVTIYVPDMTISRAGISHALKRLEKHYKEKE